MYPAKIPNMIYKKFCIMIDAIEIAPKVPTAIGIVLLRNFSLADLKFSTNSFDGVFSPITAFAMAAEHNMLDS